MSFVLGAGARSAGYRLTEFDRVDSTNAEALAAARAGDEGRRWFVTTEQTAGRGRRQRAWSTPRGNLASSILEVLDVNPAAAATLGFAAGLALQRALRAVSMEALVRSASNADYVLKWPNDVLGNGQKLAGILLEAEARVDGRLAVVVGIGTNVVSAPEGTPYPATSLQALGISASAEELFAALSDTWSEYVGIWDGGRGFAEIRRQWLEHAAGVGAHVSIQSGENPIAGIFETIDESGCMVIVTPTGERTTITAGDVYFGSAASAGAR